MFHVSFKNSKGDSGFWRGLSFFVHGTHMLAKKILIQTISEINQQDPILLALLFHTGKTVF